MRLGSRCSPGPWILAALAGLQLTCCTFPDFVSLAADATGGGSGAAAALSGAPSLGGSSGGELGSSGAGPTGGTNGNGAQAGSVSGGAGSSAGQAGSGAGSGGSSLAGGGGGGGGGGSGSGGSAGTGGSPLPPDVGPCGHRAAPTHCWNLERDADETDIDCGGPRCEPCAADEACSQDTDCGATQCDDGKCSRLFELSYVRQTPNVTVKTLGADITVKLVGSEPQLLKDLALRYYFSRNGVAEPLLPGGTAQHAGTDVSGNATWKVVRQPRGNGITNDAYLEIGFTGGRVLTPGETVSVSANLTAGDDDDDFNQTTHHSWDVAATAHESKKISVQYQGHRVWGRGALIADPPSCFHAGVNFDGTALVVSGELWAQSPDSVLARYSESTLQLRPATDAGSEEMLRTGFRFENDSFAYSVADGSYSVLVYVWSSDGGDTGTLSLNEQERDRFHAQSFQGGSPWVALGPYRIDVTGGALHLAAQGTLRVGGLELRLLDE